jgi:O-glycosyl hydrolase
MKCPPKGAESAQIGARHNFSGTTLDTRADPRFDDPTPPNQRQRDETCRHSPPLLLATLLAASPACAQTPTRAPTITHEILLTSEAGARQSPLANVPFSEGLAEGTVITIFPDSTKQTIEGIGTSFTESSAFVLAHLEPQQRRELMQKVYGESGANFTLTRTHIGACDFSVEGKYSYADEPGDRDLKAFSIAPDIAGFDPVVYPGIADPGYDLLPMIQEALAIKQGQRDQELKIIASAWTAPAWMKDIETWYIPGSAANNWQGTGGTLKPEYVATYADYLVRYLDAYADAGVMLWGLTPVNEPHGVGGAWESMAFSPESQNDFVKYHLGPRLRNSKHADARLLIYDQNMDGLEKWADTIFADLETTPHVFGAAVHWYASTVNVFEDVLDRVHAKFPEFAIIHTEGCIDNLGTAPSSSIGDPAGTKSPAGSGTTPSGGTPQPRTGPIRLHGWEMAPPGIPCTHPSIAMRATSSSAWITGSAAGWTGTSSWTATAGPTMWAISAARPS